MRNVFRLYENMKVTTKFITIYLSILIVSLTFSGFILYVQASQATISQAQTVMEQNLLQTKDSISQKVNMIENISQIIAFDTKIQTFLGSAFINESFQLEDYRYNIAPILDNIMRQNTYIHSIRIFMENDTIPELYDGFYSMKRINNKDGYREFIANQAKQSGWRNLHLAQMMTQIPGTAAADEVFSYDRKIFSTRYFDLAGMLEIEVKQDVLFDTLKDSVSDDLGNIFVIDQEGTVVSGNIPALQNKQIADLGIPELPADRKVNQIQDVRSDPFSGHIDTAPKPGTAYCWRFSYQPFHGQGDRIDENDGNHPSLLPCCTQFNCLLDYDKAALQDEDTAARDEASAGGLLGCVCPGRCQ